MFGNCSGAGVVSIGMFKAGNGDKAGGAHPWPFRPGMIASKPPGPCTLHTSLMIQSMRRASSTKIRCASSGVRTICGVRMISSSRFSRF